MRKLLLSFLLCVITASTLWSQSYIPGSVAKRIVTAGTVKGTWQYRGKNRDNILKIWALGQQKLKVEFVGIYLYKTPSGPMANDGSSSGIARIEGDTAIFKPTDLDLDEGCE